MVVHEVVESAMAPPKRAAAAMMEKRILANFWYLKANVNCENDGNLLY